MVDKLGVALHCRVCRRAEYSSKQPPLRGKDGGAVCIMCADSTATLDEVYSLAAKVATTQCSGCGDGVTRADTIWHVSKWCTRAAWCYICGHEVIDPSHFTENHDIALVRPDTWDLVEFDPQRTGAIIIVGDMSLRMERRLCSKREYVFYCFPRNASFQRVLADFGNGYVTDALSYVRLDGSCLTLPSDPGHCTFIFTGLRLWLFK